MLVKLDAEELIQVAWTLFEVQLKKRWFSSLIKVEMHVIRTCVSRTCNGSSRNLIEVLEGQRNGNSNRNEPQEKLLAVGQILPELSGLLIKNNFG